jgi:hypothetical protein
MWYSDGWVRSWRFPVGCSRCNSDKAEKKWSVKGEHTKLTGWYVIFSTSRTYKYSIRVPVCKECHADLSKPCLQQIVRPFWPFAYFRRNGKRIRFRNKFYQTRFRELNG